MNPLKPPNVLSLSFAAIALALVSCSRGCGQSSEENKSSPPSAAVGPGGPVPRTPRLDGAKTTQELLGALGKDCLPCAQKNGCLDPAQHGAVCETGPGPVSSNVSGQTEAALCLDALRCIFTTKCANSGEETPCLCGRTDIMECMEGKSPPTGSCVAEFKKDFGDDGKKMYDNFIKPEYGVGRANDLIQCVIPLCPSCRIP
jgi:hypothetical protein